MNLRAVVAISTTLALCAGCGGATDQPPDTVGPVPAPSEVATLLPVLADTVPPDVTATIPPGTLFAGDPCTALVADDFRSVNFGGVGRGTLAATRVLSEDTCGYDVRVGDDEVLVIVQMESADDFDHPVTTAQEIAKFSDIGEGAIGVARGDDRYEVLVRVSNGYFSVTSPDKTSARALAMAALERTDPA